ncbi:Uncharacterised protein [Mycobacteroides abscessus subsp. abscessus]|nr:Uncharacterised protein [Mycobacteroides abscessus subsp. abscessus]
MVDNTSGRADHHLSAPLESGQLHHIRLPAVDGQHVELGHVGAVPAESLGDL